jgi:hypothetical protein
MVDYFSFDFTRSEELAKLFTGYNKTSFADFKLPKCNGELFQQFLTGDWQLNTLMFRQEKISGQSNQKMLLRKHCKKYLRQNVLTACATMLV